MDGSSSLLFVLLGKNLGDGWAWKLVIKML